MTVDVRLLGPLDAAVLGDVAPGVFDNPVDPRWSAEFLADPRHHLAVAVDGGRVVGMASGLHYVHPDKAPELWVNEVGVAPTHEGRGVGRRLVAALLARARALGCRTAWVLTDDHNAAARRMYAAAGGVEADLPLLIEFALDEAPGGVEPNGTEPNGMGSDDATPRGEGPAGAGGSPNAPPAPGAA